MNLLYIGGFYPKKLYSTIKEDSRGKIVLSNHNFEMSMIGGLIKQSDLNLRIITAPLVYSYPYNNKRFFTKSENYLYKGCPVKSIGFCNLSVINKICLTVSLIINILSQLQKFKGKEVCIIVNTPNFYYELALLFVQKLSKKKINKTLIVPDIPSFVSSMRKSNILKSYILGFLNRASMKMAERFDHHVLLTEAMSDLFDHKLDYIVMEGLIDEDRFKKESEMVRRRENVILYTGSLRKVFGVLDLVDAFDNEMFNDAELWICGSGEAANQIIERSKTNPNIHYLGLVDSDEAIQLQKQATILVNPRSSKGEFTKYSFPSKTIEYILSGAAVIINKLPGIPDEYYKYVYLPQDESIESWRKIIRFVLNLSDNEKKEMSQNGISFILNNKNSYVQMQRILCMIKKRHENICYNTNI